MKNKRRIVLPAERISPGLTHARGGLLDSPLRPPGRMRGRGPKTIHVACLVFVAFLACGWNLCAEEKPPLRLTLREAVELALKQNPEVQVSNLSVAQSEEDRRIARAALMPQVSLTTSERVSRRNLEAFIGRRLPGVPQHAGPFTTFEAGPMFSMPIFDLTLWRRWQAAHQGVKGIEAQELTVREQTTLLVASQYLASLRAVAEVRATESRARLAQELYDQAIELQRQGIGTRIDTLRAQVRLQNEKQRAIVAQTQLKTALHGVVRLLNLDPLQAVELTDEMTFFETPECPAAPTLERALASRPELKALESRELVATFQKKAANGARLPRIRLEGGWAYQGLSAATAIPSYQYQATLEVPLFTGGRIRAEAARADLELRKIAQEKQDWRNRIAWEVKTAIDQLAAARHEVEVTNLGATLAEEEVAQARERFREGVAGNIEVTTAQDALARAHDNQISALYRYSQARADLARAMGGIETLYTR